jgi:hypothetical protein
MQPGTEELKELQQKIFKAFADVLYPEGKLAAYDCEECRDLEKTFTKLNWRTIDREILEEYFGIIPLFTPESFRYFLPAYLIYSLEHFSPYDTTCEFTIYALTPSNKNMNEKDMRNYWRDRFQNFTPEQMNCIYEFLDFVLDDENFYLFTKEVNIGKQNLKQLIKSNFG